MNPAFFILLIIVIIVIWVLCVFVFIPLGSFIKKIYNKLKTTIEKEDTEETKEEQLDENDKR